MLKGVKENNPMSQRQPKTKPAARGAEPIEPEPPQPTARELRMAEVARTLKAFEETAAFLARLDSHQIYLLQAFLKIMDNDRGCTTPIEEFISDLVWHWAKEDEDGQGLTLERIESEVETLRKGHLSEEIRNAHWMASRYPLPEPEQAEQPS
jgi:hypothetical protein